MVPVPNFLIAGAPKAATTFLHNALTQHPEIFLTQKKEPRFFAFEGCQVSKRDRANRNVITDFDSYLNLFQGSEGYSARGEASPVYFGSMQAPRNIHKRFPDIRFIVVVRQPVERAYSHFIFAKQKGFEPSDATFYDALITPEIIYRGFRRVRPYLHDSNYGKSFRRYLEYFDRSQFLFLRHEHVRSDVNSVLKSVERFLNVRHYPYVKVSNHLAASGEPTSPFLYKMSQSRSVRWTLRAMLGRNAAAAAQSDLTARLLVKRQLSNKEWNWAMGHFGADLEDFENLSGLDLSDWKRSGTG